MYNVNVVWKLVPPQLLPVVAPASPQLHLPLQQLQPRLQVCHAGGQVQDDAEVLPQVLQALGPAQQEKYNMQVRMVQNTRRSNHQNANCVDQGALLNKHSGHHKDVLLLSRPNRTPQEHSPFVLTNGAGRNGPITSWIQSKARPSPVAPPQLERSPPLAARCSSTPTLAHLLPSNPTQPTPPPSSVSQPVPHPTWCAALPWPRAAAAAPPAPPRTPRVPTLAAPPPSACRTAPCHSSPGSTSAVHPRG